MALICVFVCPYLLCYFASSAIDRISNIQRCVYDLNWYNFSPELQKFIILIMAQSQRRIYFDGLNLIRCTLATFWKVTFYLIINQCTNWSLVGFFCLTSPLWGFFSPFAARSIVNLILYGF